MEIKTMTVDELLARKEEIAAEVDSLEDIEAVQARRPRSVKLLPPATAL